MSEKLEEYLSELHVARSELIEERKNMRAYLETLRDDMRSFFFTTKMIENKIMKKFDDLDLVAVDPNTLHDEITEISNLFYEITCRYEDLEDWDRAFHDYNEYVVEAENRVDDLEAELEND